MKIRWISIILLIVMFLAVQGVGYGEDEQACGVVVMFGNGMWTTANDANRSRRTLEKRLEAHISGTELEGVIEYDVSINPHEGYLEDFLEAFDQIIQISYSNFWHYLYGLDIMPDVLQDKFKEFANEFDEYIASASPSVQEHIEDYDNYLQEGKVVVLVAHSQGNLYGYIANRGINTDYIDGFGIVSVAPPASDTTVDNPWPYTTIDEDVIIASIPLSPESNLDNFLDSENMTDWSGHGFIDSYMVSGHDAETSILDDVVDMINDLDFPHTSSNNTTAVFVVGVATGSSGEYDSAVVSTFIDQSKINWIAWNDAPQVELTRSSRPGEVFLGPGGFGTNDYITLTVVAPSGASQTINIDQNDNMGVSYGTQNVIFGCAGNAPDVFRQNPSFANPPNLERFLDEGGSHNAIFTEPGSYEFQFSFQSPYGSGSHGNIYLLINSLGVVVP